MQETFTEDLLILQRIFLNRESHLWKAEFAALAVASGAAALSYTFQALTKAGEHIVAAKTIYGGTYNYLAHTLPLNNNVTTTFVDPYVEGSFEAAIQENTKAIFVETLGNPNSNVADHCRRLQRSLISMDFR